MKEYEVQDLTAIMTCWLIYYLLSLVALAYILVIFVFQPRDHGSHPTIQDASECLGDEARPDPTTKEVQRWRMHLS